MSTFKAKKLKSCKKLLNNRSFIYSTDTESFHNDFLEKEMMKGLTINLILNAFL